MAHKVLAGEPFTVTVDGETYTILPEEVEVRLDPRAEYATMVDGPYTVALDTTLTPELREEGWVREFLHQVQNLRKEADLDFTDRIRIYYQAPEEVARALEANREYIMQETLAVEMEPGAFRGQAKKQASATFSLDGAEVQATVVKVEKTA